MHERRDVVVSLTCTEGNVALNLIESLRNAEAMGVWGNRSSVTWLALGDGLGHAAGESFSRRSFRVCYGPITSYTSFHRYLKTFSFQLERHTLGADAECGGEARQRKPNNRINFKGKLDFGLHPAVSLRTFTC